MNVITDDNANEIQKSAFFNIIGIAIKNTNEGITIKNIEVDNSETLLMFLVSKYSQIIASIDVKGNEANIAAIVEYLLLISEIATTSIEVIIIFII